jgi:hypothetical protein
MKALILQDILNRQPGYLQVAVPSKMRRHRSPARPNKVNLTTVLKSPRTGKDSTCEQLSLYSYHCVRARRRQ